MASGIVSKVKGGFKMVWVHWVLFLVFGIIFGAFAWPWVRGKLMDLKTKTGVPIPDQFTTPK
jgi:hypothetical protein